MSLALQYPAIGIVSLSPLPVCLSIRLVTFGSSYPADSSNNRRCEAYLGVTNQFHCSSFIWCKACNFTYDGTNRVHSFALFAFTVRWTRLDNSSFSLVTTSDTPGETRAGNTLLVNRVTAVANHGWIEILSILTDVWWCTTEAVRKLDSSILRTQR